MRTIEVTISPKGETTIATKGFTGSSCREASKFLEDALGQRVSERPTAEFYHTENATQVQQRQ